MTLIYSAVRLMKWFLKISEHCTSGILVIYLSWKLSECLKHLITIYGGQFYFSGTVVKSNRSQCGNSDAIKTKRRSLYCWVGSRLRDEQVRSKKKLHVGNCCRHLDRPAYLNRLRHARKKKVYSYNHESRRESSQMTAKKKRKKENEPF